MPHMYTEKVFKKYNLQKTQNKHFKNPMEIYIEKGRQLCKNNVFHRTIKDPQKVKF